MPQSDTLFAGMAPKALASTTRNQVTRETILACMYSVYNTGVWFASTTVFMASMLDWAGLMFPASSMTLNHSNDAIQPSCSDLAYSTTKTSTRFPKVAFLRMFSREILMVSF